VTKLVVREPAPHLGFGQRVAERVANESHTSRVFRADTVPYSLLERSGLEMALDCDANICCVNRPWPRDVLNRLAYLHLIPVIDGGIFALVSERGTLVHVDWRIHIIGPGRACLYCLGAQFRSDAVLDRDGRLDDPDYIQGLAHDERERYARRNVFAETLRYGAGSGLPLGGCLVWGCRRADRFA
jgi:hypothetical protein